MSRFCRCIVVLSVLWQLATYAPSLYLVMLPYTFSALLLFSIFALYWGTAARIAVDLVHELLLICNFSVLKLKK